MTIYLIKGYLDHAATTLADAQALLAALADPNDPDNAAVIGRVMAKLEGLVQSDTGEPLVISSIDDTGGTISSWVTDASTILAVGLGDPDPSQSYLYASTLSFSISGNTRVGTLALNTAELQRAVTLARPHPFYTLQIRKTTSGLTETVALLSIPVEPGVLSGSPTNLAAAAYIDTAAFLSGAIHPLPSLTSLTGGGATALDGIVTGGDALPTGYTALLSMSRVGQLWQLIDGTDAEDVSAGVVRPDDYHASTNARIWVLI